MVPFPMAKATVSSASHDVTPCAEQISKTMRTRILRTLLSPYVEIYASFLLNSIGQIVPQDICSFHI